MNIPAALAAAVREELAAAERRIAARFAALFGAATSPTVAPPPPTPAARPSPAPRARPQTKRGAKSPPRAERPAAPAARPRKRRAYERMSAEAVETFRAQVLDAVPTSGTTTKGEIACALALSPLLTSKLGHALSELVARGELRREGTKGLARYARA